MSEAEMNEVGPLLNAIGLNEFNSIARGIEAADAMLKTGDVHLLVARTVCPGKYVVLVAGEVAAVNSAVEAGARIGSANLVDTFLLPNVHPSVLPAFSGPTGVELRALGIIETFSVASAVIAADTAVKAAFVDLVEVRLAVGIGGKSFVIVTGDVGAVKSAVQAGVASAAEKGLLVSEVVIPSPAPELLTALA